MLKPFILRQFLLGCFLMGAGLAGAEATDPTGRTNFMVNYAAKPEMGLLLAHDMAIVDPEAVVDFPAVKKAGRKILAYVEAVPKACNQGQWLRPGQNKKSRRSVFAPPARNECAMLVFS